MRAPISITLDGVIEVSNYVRDLPEDIARRATFVIDIGRGEDDRPEHEKHVSGCESAACLLSDRASSLA
jgi:hypothetical protein